MSEPSPRRWLSVGPASELLGVSESTVRRRADAGDISAYRTDGGHRRILEADVYRLSAEGGRLAVLVDADRISELALTRVKRHIARRRSDHSMDAFQGLDEPTRARLRFIGGQLVELFAQFVSSRTRGRHFTDDARDMGREYGCALVAADVTLTDAVGTFNALRRALEGTVPQLTTEAKLPANEALEAVGSILSLADTILEGMAEVYQDSV